MERLQYDSFYKFLISLGIVLITVPFISFFALINISNQFLFTKEEMQNLAENSFYFLEKRNYLVQIFFNFMPYFFFIFLFLGFIFIIYGAYKWWVLQKEIDEQLFITTKEKKFSLEKMTTSDIVKKQAKDYENKIDKDNKAEIFDSLLIEDYCSTCIKNKLPKYYQVNQNVKAIDTSFDIVASSKKEDILFEIKYISKEPDLNKIKHQIKYFQDSCEKYKSKTLKKVRCIFVYTIPDNRYNQISYTIKKYTSEIDKKEIQIEFLKHKSIGDEK